MLNHVRLFMLSQMHKPDPWAKGLVDIQSEPFHPPQKEAPTISKLNMPLKNPIHKYKCHLVLLKLEGLQFHLVLAALLSCIVFLERWRIEESKVCVVHEMDKIPWKESLGCSNACPDALPQ